MAYEGYLIKIGNWQVPWNYIQGDTYDVSPNKIKVKEFTDYNGERHVVYSKNLSTVIQFETPKNFKLTNDDIAAIREALAAAKDVDADTYVIHYYNPRTGVSEMKSCSLDDLTYTVYSANEKNIFYAPMKFTFREVATIDL